MEMDNRYFVNSESRRVHLGNILRTLPFALLITDILGLIICFGVYLSLSLNQPLGVLDPLLATFFVLILGGLYLANTYRPDSQIVGLRSPYRIIISNAIVAILFSAGIYLLGLWQQNQLMWRSTLYPCLGIFTLWGVTSRLWAATWVRTQSEQSRWLILGANPKAMEFCRRFLDKHPFAKFIVLAESLPDKVKPYELSATNGSHDSLDEALMFYVNRNGSGTQKGGATLAEKTLEVEAEERIFLQSPNVNYLGTLSDLPSLTSQAWSGIIVATQSELADEQVRNIMPLRLRGIPIYRLPEAYETLWFKLPSSLLEDTWFAFSGGFNLVPGGFNFKLKRIIDATLAAVLLLVLSPLMLLTAIAIKLDSPGDIFYSQYRTGLNGRPFRVYKFRSMYKDAEKQGAQWAAKRDSRITRVGQFIRLTRIDELPQIWNVLSGEMSLIGPRPERPEFDAKLKQEILYYDVRYLVKPGITGWAQVMYPYGASVEDAYQKLSYDLYYIKNYSLWLDIAIFFKTVRVVLLGKGR
ncbi:MAG: sugar transferase [Nostocaceae cyanobacterium]|nr:sugar transferase [Nostocaceae cyanobacterium]